MVRIRVIEETIADFYPQQEMRCPVHLSVGQEAIPVGVCAHLTPKDYILSGHRSHSHYLAKGGNLKAMMAEIYGKVSGCCSGKGGSMHLVDLDCGFLGAVPIVGSTIPIAVGAAFGSHLKKEDRVTVSFFGEGATEEGVLHESINFAVLKNLPIIFICENNLFSVYSPLSVRRKKGQAICDLIAGYGIPANKFDGNNLVEIYNASKGAVDRARNNGGPSFLEFTTYRWLEHCGPFYDNDIGYRTVEEFETWRSKCPIERTEDLLIQQGVLNKHEIDKIRCGFKEEMVEAVDYAKKSPFPDKSTLMKHVYAP